MSMYHSMVAYMKTKAQGTFVFLARIIPDGFFLLDVLVTFVFFFALFYNFELYDPLKTSPRSTEVQDLLDGPTLEHIRSEAKALGIIGLEEVQADERPVPERTETQKKSGNRLKNEGVAEHNLRIEQKNPRKAYGLKSDPLQAHQFLSKDDVRKKLRAQKRYNVSLIGQSLKVALTVAENSDAPRQFLKLRNGEIIKLRAIDFLSNPYRANDVRHGIKMLRDIFWLSAILSLIFGFNFLYKRKKYPEEDL
jgi:hypothetical protein